MGLEVSDEARVVMRFGRAEVHPLRRELSVDGTPVRIGDRAFDLLLALIERRGELVTKDELLARVWPGLVVEDINLSVQVSALRKALGAERDNLKTISGRGYRFVAEVAIVAPGATGATAVLSGPVSAAADRTNLPALNSELIGREADVQEVIALMSDRRLVTLSGPGGIGKTRLGLDVARRLLPRFPDGAWLAELGPLSDPALVPATVATALGIQVGGGIVSAERVAAALGLRQVLLVLDNCEHLVGAAAAMTEALLRASPVASVIATSREPLRAEGECVYQVPPLAVPDSDVAADDDVMRHGAVQLFVARARAAQPHFTADRVNGVLAAAICRRLDGIPLAIELAAARAAALGVEGLAARLDDRFRLLTDGRRTALPRQQTLRATLDWSHDLLPATERVLLRRLAIFAGTFSLDAATDVVGSGELSPADVLDSIVNLVSKSLVVADLGSAVAQYRLLETTRAYALEKLRTADEYTVFARRHAEYYRDLFESVSVQWEQTSTAAWLAAHGRHLDNVRAALDWAFAPEGNERIGVALTAAAVPLWMHLSMMEECRARVDRALAAGAQPTGDDARRSMQLQAALGLALMYTRGAVPETRAALSGALAIAEALGDADYQLRALWGLCVDRLNNAVFREALAFAERFRQVADRDGAAADRPIGDRMMGLSLHFLGEEERAQQHFERMLATYVEPARRSHLVRFQFDQRVTAEVAFAEVLWIRGYPDRALRSIIANIEEAEGLGHALSLCNALAKACPVALLAGDLATAGRMVSMLIEHAARNALASWLAEGQCFQGVLLLRTGNRADGIATLEQALAGLPGINFSLRYTGLLGELAEALGVQGDVARGLSTIESALARATEREERWCMPELLRIKGDLLARRGGADALRDAEACLEESLAWSRRQQALSWELRGAASLARLLHEQRRTEDARSLLTAAYGRFREGFDTADLVSAKALLATLN